MERPNSKSIVGKVISFRVDLSLYRFSPGPHGNLQLHVWSTKEKRRKKVKLNKNENEKVIFLQKVLLGDDSPFLLGSLFYYKAETIDLLVWF